MKKTEMSSPWSVTGPLRGDVTMKMVRAALCSRVLSIAIMIFAAGLTASGATIVWGGSTGTDLDWTLATNWSGGVAPVAGDDVVFDTPGVITFSVLPASVSYNSVTVLQGTVTLAGSAATVFTIGGNSGVDLPVMAGGSLILGTNAGITLAPGAQAAIEGSIIVGTGSILSVGNDGVTAGITGSVTNNGTMDLGAGTAVVAVSGTLINTGTLSGTSATRLLFAAGAIYNHARNGGTIPVASWDTASECLVTGMTSTGVTIPAATQPFGNFTWNCASQSMYHDFAGQLTDVRGDFKVLSTGTVNIQFGREVDAVISIGGSYIQQAGIVSLGPKYAVNTITMNVGGDFSLAAGVLFYVCTSSGTGILNVNGDLTSTGFFNFTYDNTPATGTVTVKESCTINGGAFNMSKSTSTGILYVAGHFSHTAGQLTETSDGAGIIYFNGTAPQVFTSGGYALNNISYTVKNGSFLQMASSSTTVKSNGIFTLEDGATLGIRSADGLIADVASATGNIQTTGGRVYSPAANYCFNSDLPQMTGEGFTTGNTMIINNPAGVYMTQPVSVTNVTIGDVVAASFLKDRGYQLTATGTLDLVSGTFFLGSSTRSSLFPAFTTMNYGDGTRVEYESAVDEEIAGVVYPDLMLRNSKKTIAATSAVTVNGNLTTNDKLVISSTLTSGGSLIVKGTSTGLVTYNRQLNTEAGGGDSYLISSPVEANTVANTDKVTAIKAWDEPTGLMVAADMTAMTSGAGYALDQTAASDGLIVFTGTVVGTDVVVAASSPYSDVVIAATTDYNSRTWAAGRDGGANYGGGGWMLTGNPYTSALSVPAFLNSNYSAVAADCQIDPGYAGVYLYDGAADVYRVISNKTGWEDEYPYDNIQPGQGFFVRAMNDDAAFTITRAMQVHSLAGAVLKAEPTVWPGLRLKVAYGTGERSTLILFNSDMTAGLDPGYDMGLLSTTPEVEIYTKLINDNGLRFCRQALPMLNFEQNIVNVGIDSDNGGSVTFSATIVPVAGYKFYLEDRTAGIFTDLSLNSYTVTLPANTHGTGRFFLYTSNGDPSSAGPGTGETGDLTMWASDGTISIKGELSGNALCSVYDLSGKKISETVLTDRYMNSVPMHNKARGIYIVVVTDGRSVYRQKIVN